jgi:hypothetical protein
MICGLGSCQSSLGIKHEQLVHQLCSQLSVSNMAKKGMPSVAAFRKMMIPCAKDRYIRLEILLQLSLVMFVDLEGYVLFI